ncbi:uncharacterized protein LOC135844671 [Planococcus citri]|uniref:uncharacterized protein LOC135844671 n=1 Tax=Planococcus citri TaxID=170843 RepID=UPI0031F8423C
MYGRCYDGHIHRIRMDSQKTATENKQQFKSSMFHRSILKGNEMGRLRSDTFESLPAQSCPNSFFFNHQVSTSSSKLTTTMSKRKLKSYYEDIKPFEGDSDLRSAAQFLQTFENHVDRFDDVSNHQSKQKLFYLIKPAIDLNFEDVTSMRYEDLRDYFLNKFWNMPQQYKVYAEFLRNSHPMYQGQKVSAYVNLWVDRFRNNTIVLSNDFISSLLNRIPVRFGVYVLRKSHPQMEPEEICDLVKACESDLCLIERKDELAEFL